ncbi:fungal hydrophobin-domain-containing protein, partial [Mycena polygramma]
ERHDLPYLPCPHSIPECAQNALNLLDLECSNPSRSPTDLVDFRRICMDVGKMANCCQLGIAHQALLCQDPPN